jgi:putative hydrolase
MFDFHTHTSLSDGALNPAEHIRRAEVAGYRALGISDHVDLATMQWIVQVAKEAARRENELGRLIVLAGAELTHVRCVHIEEATQQLRELGCDYVVCHGETTVEPVEPGTNRAAIEAGVDILAHPGLIEESDVALAAERGVALEITAKGGHNRANGHVAALARKHGATLLYGSDAHTPSQILRMAEAELVCRGAGLSDEEVAKMFADAEEFAMSRRS